MTKHEPAKFNAVDARKLIREMLKAGAAIVILPHANAQAKKRNIDALMMKRCLEMGTISEGPTLDHNGLYKVNVTRHGPDPITCVVVINPPDQLLLVTVFKEK